MGAPLLVVKPLGGIGNRLRVVSSFHAVAVQTGRRFAVCWAPSLGFSDEPLDALFETDLETVDVDAYRTIASCGLPLDDVMRGWGADRRWTWPDGTSSASLTDPHHHPTITYEGCFATDIALGPELACAVPGCDAVTAELLRTTWRPAPPLRSTIEDLVGRLGPSSVGVHIRRGDALVDVGTRWRARASSDAAFRRRIDGVLAGDPSVRLYLATDDEPTQARFLDRYGERIVVNQSKRFVPSRAHQPKDNQRDAAIDLFCLAATTRILGSNASSFSQMAGAVGDIPVERVASRHVGRLVGNKLRHEVQRARARLRRNP